MRNIAVIGLGNFGTSVARALTDAGAQVIAVDENKDRVEAIKDSVAFAVALNATDKAALESVSITQVDVAVVCVGEDVEANLLTTLLLKKLGVRKIWCRAINPLQQEILKTLEVDEIINLEEQMGATVARRLASASISNYIPLARGQSIAEVQIPEAFAGKSLRELDVRKNFKVNVVAIKTLKPAINDLGERELEETVDVVPPIDEKLPDDCILIVAGEDRNIERIAKGRK